MHLSWIRILIQLQAMNLRYLAPILTIVIAASAPASGAITAGLLSDFQDGTTQGWSGGAAPSNISTGGPAGTGDRFLQIGGGNRFATFNSGLEYSGALDLSVTSIQVGLMRLATDIGSLDMRLVLFGPGTDNAWTSTLSQAVPNDGVWRSYTFSTSEADLTQVRSDGGSYGNLVASVDRVMLRYDPGTPTDSGESASGTLGIDNVTAVPEPSLVAMLAVPALVFGARRRR